MGTELKLRIVSALVMAAVVLAVTWLGGHSFVLLWAVAAMLVILEFTRICSNAIPKFPKIAAIICMLLIIIAWISNDHSTAFIIFGVGFFVLALWELFLNKSLWSATGLIYASLPFFAIIELRGSSNNSLLAIIVLFACVWGADIFAYIAGRSIGGPKLAPKISPKKTWAGFIGSLFGAVFLSWSVIAYAGYKPSLVFILIVIVLAVISQIGDLVESSFKRQFGVKDSGNIIPGHGGVLDRIDGLIFAAILFWLILWTIPNAGADNLTLPEIFVNAFLTA